jgi:hypothetical protein
VPFWFVSFQSYHSLLFRVLGVRAFLLRVLAGGLLLPVMFSRADLYGSLLVFHVGFCYHHVSWTDRYGLCLFGILMWAFATIMYLGPTFMVRVSLVFSCGAFATIMYLGPTFMVHVSLIFSCGHLLPACILDRPLWFMYV